MISEQTDNLSAQDAPRRAKPRITGIDAARGVALIAMATYHFCWDLESFGYIASGTAGTGLWKLYARSIASSFLFLVGVGLVLGHRPHIRWKPFFIRFAKIAAAALVVTIATYFAFPNAFIFFGILHAIAAMSFVGLLFLRLPVPVTILAALAAFLAPVYLRATLFDQPALWWVGLSTVPIRSNDYVPLFPWLAAPLAGIAVGRLALRHGWLTALAARESRSTHGLANTLRQRLAWLGRHSLAFYLLHQPVLLGLVYLATLIAPPPKPDPRESYRQSCVQSCSLEQPKPFCEIFCTCTLTRLTDENMLDALNAGQIDVTKDPRIQAMAAQCTSVALPPDPTEEAPSSPQTEPAQ
ncbi:hypothetical protein BJF93_22310 [Xaviernesmea oryzae]|uniref:Heparan-alpha-glucosaminide N-acetyltransferase catalytic domain-containing protein n=1 Tax=Xaviernesmea oryzae TaxID=464029 RepID=A0A1Q9AYM7_9HYPH|nr:DUF1624 domain-containing protein [Xaviernesmea oryzae]OLP60556.1 hypothetical protein BJF93_22310 [Xaviernesmea oryzae]SEM28919.1 Uncharacterized membrane protein [Xaviernesmea oryzae]